MEEMEYIPFKQLILDTDLSGASRRNKRQRTSGGDSVIVIYRTPNEFTLAELWEFYVLINSTDYLVDLIA